jgi:VIT1/CCC1 family predicted Fe2+/Mn2+ transporter
MLSMSRKGKAVFIRNFVFGVEDSLVSTVGLLAGIAAANIERSTILLTGSVLIMVEAFSMAIGSLLSEEQVEQATDGKTSEERSLGGSITMFISYALSGLIPLAPYAFLEPKTALQYSIAASLLALALLGYISGKTFTKHPLRSLIRMVLLGGMAIVAGVIVGQVFKV